MFECFILFIVLLLNRIKLSGNSVQRIFPIFSCFLEPTYLKNLLKQKKNVFENLKNVFYFFLLLSLKRGFVATRKKLTRNLIMNIY